MREKQLTVKLVNLYSLYMYAKVFSRITESSLMEEAIPVRYTFVMLLAIADPTGLVVGTDVALARRLNMPVPQFRRCVKALQEPDADSNSKEEDGRRIMVSDGERGYQVVNFVKYRDMKDEEEKRRYMREYMRERRKEEAVKAGKLLLNPLADVTHADADADADASVATPYAERPSLKEFTEFGTSPACGIAAWKAEDTWNEMQACGWLDYKHRPVKDWHSFLIRVKTKWEADGRPKGPPSNANHAGTRQQGADRNAGTANAKTIGEYDGVGKVLPVRPERPAGSPAAT